MKSCDWNCLTSCLSCIANLGKGVESELPLTFVQVQSSISDSILDALYRNRSDVEIAKSKKSAHTSCMTGALVLVPLLIISMAACLLLLIITTHHVISPQNLPSSLHFPERVSELSSTWTYVKPS